MRRLHYTGESVLVSDEIGVAVMRYAQALADTHMSDIVTVPVLGDDGQVARAEFLLGPASQLYSVPAPGDIELATDDQLIADLDVRIRRLRPSAEINVARPEHTEFDSG